jgi:hypothetical protein
VKQLHTKYRIRARIPADVVRATGLIAEARSAGVELKQDSEGNLEGVWDATPFSLEQVVEGLREMGLRGFMIERSMIYVTIAVSAQRLEKAEIALRKAASGSILQTEDVFTGDKVMSCMVSCEAGLSLRDGLEKEAECKMIAAECFVVVTEKSDE